MSDHLLQKIEESDSSGVQELIRDEIDKKGQAWAIHLSLFPLAQRVQNPPFINPHLPKMHAIYRELKSYLQEDEIPALIRLEINEFTQRPKAEEIPKTAGQPASVSFPDIETTIREDNPQQVAALLYAFLKQEGEAELARNLLLLGSSYLDDTLGHSLSCTAFILLEMLERTDQDPWPALAALADYFCEGRFHTMPDLHQTPEIPKEEELDQHLLRATSGSGIVNLHHTITRYAIERVRHLLSQAEYAHMIARWIEFMGSKSVKLSSLDSAAIPAGYQTFYQIFSQGEEKQVLSSLAGMTSSEEGRQRLGSYLIKGVCDLYRGRYDPHFLTGLGSALWVINRHWDRTPIIGNCLSQYLNYFFTQMIY